jgi:hypothetical protein
MYVNYIFWIVTSPIYIEEFLSWINWQKSVGKYVFVYVCIYIDSSGHVHITKIKL